MFCRNCGKEILDDDKFCSYCGTKVEEEIVDFSNKPIESPVWGWFAKIGFILSLITLIGGCLSFGFIGVWFGSFAIPLSALGLKSKDYHAKAKQALKISIIGYIISDVLFAISLISFLILTAYYGY